MRCSAAGAVDLAQSRRARAPAKNAAPPPPSGSRRCPCRPAKKDHAVLIMGASIAFLILALRSGAVGVRLLARFAHRPVFAVSRTTAVFPPRSRLRARPSTAPANKNPPATAIVRRQRAYRSATLREFNWRAWKPDLPSSGFRFGRVPLMHLADRALRGDGDMKSRFALALLASVAVIAAMATDGVGRRSWRWRRTWRRRWWIPWRRWWRLPHGRRRRLPCDRWRRPAHG